MKHVISLITLSAVVLLTSCITTTKTARTAETSASIKNATVADLKVTDHRITYTMSPSKAIQRAGLSNVKQAAIQEALTKHGNADVMVEPEFVIEQERTLFGHRINSITVSGRPAYYENFRTLNDTVWATPGFYGQPNVVYVDKVPNGNGGYGSYGAKRGGLKGLADRLSGRNKTFREDTGWRRSGLGGQFELIGGMQSVSLAEGPGELDHSSKAHPYGGALLTLGYNLTSHWFLGVGSGWYWDGDQEMGFVPIFGKVRYNFSSRKRSTWFIDLKVGGTVITNESDLNGGVLAGWTIGYDFGNFAIGWQTIYNQFEADDWESSYYSSTRPKWDVSHVGLSLAFTF